MALTNAEAEVKVNNNEAMLVVDGVVIKDPSSLTWGLQDNSDSDAGRVLKDDKMYKNRTSQKVKLELSWNSPSAEQASKILKAFNPEYIMVTYHDAMENTAMTKEFYVGDRSAPVAHWFVGDKRYASISFNIVER